MCERIPARATVETWAINPDASHCKCGKPIYRSGSIEKDGVRGVLHHDHLLNFAKRAVEQFGGAGWARKWQKSVGVVRYFCRFDPIWICEKCNEGDGWAKSPNWHGRKYITYPLHFSMMPGELKRMQDAQKTKTATKAADEIWREARREHLQLRSIIRAWAQGL